MNYVYGIWPRKLSFARLLMPPVSLTPDFDSHFLPGYAPLFYSVAGTGHLSTNALPEVGNAVQIPFDIIKNEGESFTIEAIDHFRHHGVIDFE